MNVSYVLPILRRPDEDDLNELTSYLRWLSARVELIVVDGSDDATFEEAHILWEGAWVHVPPDPAWSYLNGKVNGVHTGMALVTHEAVIIADDDVRYDEAALEAVTAALSHHHLVMPQNHFDPLPWHACWDTARTLLNRCFGADSPGTLGVRASAFRAVGGYDGDVMYENLELIRTVAGAGGRVDHRPDIHVRRLPPTTRRFLEQRPRQAYDDLAQPLKFTMFLSAFPLAAVARHRTSFTTLAACVSVAGWTAAALGRRRHGGRDVFPLRTVWWAPVWLLERSVCIWIALFHRLGGGVPYNGNRLRTAAHSERRLRSTLVTDPASHAAPPTGPGVLVSSARARRTGGPSERPSQSRSNDMSRASDRRVLVTGAARGIGAATARAFAAAGADVAIVDVDPGPEGDQVVADMEAAGGRGLAIQADLTTVEQCVHAVDSAVGFLGGLDVLVNNAGGNLGIYATFEEVTEEQFDRVLSLNLKSAFFVSQASIAHLRERPGGRIINLASELVWVGYELMPAYVAAKGAVVALTRSMARAAAPDVTVNAVAPGPTATERFKRGKWYREEKERREADIPLGRFGDPDDIARFIVSLAGEAGDWCTGQTFHVNGGVVMP